MQWLAPRRAEVDEVGTTEADSRDSRNADASTNARIRSRLTVGATHGVERGLGH
jgi:hypothetical protein